VLLHDYFGLEVELPRDSLVPRIPQRMNYVLLVEDLLRLNGLNRDGAEVTGIDIGRCALIGVFIGSVLCEFSGVGSSVVYPLLGAKLNGWNFYASDVDPNVLRQASVNVRLNSLEKRIHLVQSGLVGDVFRVGLLLP
jgi:23S rRNA A1618 N6-methylase RlmF